MPETLEAYKLNLQDWCDINKEDILRANKLSPKAQNKDRIRVLISRSHLDNKTKAFIDELIKQSKDTLDADALADIVKTCNVLKNEKVQAAKRKVKGQAQKAQAKRDKEKPRS